MDRPSSLAGHFDYRGCWLAAGQDLSLLAGGIAAWAITKSISLRMEGGGFIDSATCGHVLGFSVAVALQRGPLIAVVLSVAIGLFSLCSGRDPEAVPFVSRLHLSWAPSWLLSPVSAFASSSGERARDVGGLIDTFGNLLASDRSYQQRSGRHPPATSIKLVAANPVIGYGTGGQSRTQCDRARRSVATSRLPLGRPSPQTTATCWSRCSRAFRRRCCLHLLWE